MERKLVLGMGAGQCGLRLLAEVLGTQRGARVTFEQPPLLPWEHRAGQPGIKERLERFLKTTTERMVGDVASFYLPYAEEAIDWQPGIRIVCLKRPREEIVAAFCRFLDSGPYPINHWAKEPAPGWWHDPYWTRTFPQYDTQDREEGIRRYWDEYYARAEELAGRFPENLRVFDTEVLTAEEGVREVLGFAGFEREEQVVVVGRGPAGRDGVGGERARAVRQAGSLPYRGRYPHPMDPRRCVVLVPFIGSIQQECEDGLKELERRGYQVRRVGGYAAIDQGRNQMATDALKDGFEETLWIDSDIGFHPDSVDRLRSHPEPILCGVYPQKGKRALACHVMPGAPAITFGQEGGLVEILYAGAGFLLVRREVYLAVQEQHRLPMCNERFGVPLIPFFYPLIRPIEEAWWYLAEDYAFCHRARECGYRILADTSIRLWHIGVYRYGWEDAGTEQRRFGTFTLGLAGPPPHPNPLPQELAAHESIGRAEHFGGGKFLGEREPERGRGAPMKSEVPDPPAALAEFARRHAWPEEKPEVAAFPKRDWLFPGTQEMLQRSVSDATRLIVEVGSWTGRSTRFLADLAPQAAVIAIDHWQGSPEHREDPELAPLLPRLYEAFLSECWDYRDRIIPVRAGSVEGLRRVAEAGLTPELVYVDADHRLDAVLGDVTAALDLFPAATIVGDDWNWDGVRCAVEKIAAERRIGCEAFGSGWRFLPV